MFEVNHLGFSTQRGRFDRSSGKIMLDAAAKKGNIELVIETASIDMGFDKWNEKMKGPDFFSVVYFPTMRFVSDKIVFDGDKPVAAEGELTCRSERAAARRPLPDEVVVVPAVLRLEHLIERGDLGCVFQDEQLQRRLWHYPYGELMLQEYLPADEDYRVMVLGYHGLPAMVSRKPPKGDFRTNYSLGGRFTRHNLSEFPGYQSLAENAARALRREFTDIDIRLKGDQPMVLEVNRQPDFEGFERATKFLMW